MSYRIDAETGVLFVHGEGQITQTERLETMRTWLADPGFGSHLRTLADFSAAETTPTLPELREIVEAIKKHSPPVPASRVAIVAPQTAKFGVARQFQAVAELTSLDVQVFRDRESALNWLRAAR